MRDYPKYIVEWQTSYDWEHWTPAQAGIEALMEMRLPEVAVIVHDVDTGRMWDVRFSDHVLEILEVSRVEVQGK